METDSTVIDAVPQDSLPKSLNEETWRVKHSKEEFDRILNTVCDSFSTEDFYSVFFLLMDKLIDLDEFLSIIKSRKLAFKQRIQKMQLSEETVIELLGTLKMYKALTFFNTCFHVFKIREPIFQNIKRIWKVLYALCEEISDSDLKSLSENLPKNFQNQIVCAEQWFTVLLKLEIITTNNISELKIFFKNNAVCLRIINDFENPKLESYVIKNPTNKSPCGLALILNYESFHTTEDAPGPATPLKLREGSSKDVDSLQELWHKFGFQTIVKENLTRAETLLELKNIAMKDHSKYDAFVCCILSHGNSNVIYAADSRPILIKKIISVISKTAKSLKEKPKLFFIQACQGTQVHDDNGNAINFNNSHQQLNIDSNAADLDAAVNVADMDILEVVACINGFVSFRDPEKGSLFVQSLCKIMLEYGSNNSLIDVISHVTDHVSQKKIDLGIGKPNAIQIPPTYTTLRKKLILKKQDC